MAPKPEDTGSGLPSHPPLSRPEWEKVSPKTGEKACGCEKATFFCFPNHAGLGRLGQTLPMQPASILWQGNGPQEEQKKSNHPDVNAEIKLPSCDFKVMNHRRVRRRVVSLGFQPGIWECKQGSSTLPYFWLVQSHLESKERISQTKYCNALD